MAWLTSLRKKAEPEAVAVAVAEAVEAPVATGPGLGVLIPDSGGISSFRFTLQPDAAGAEAQIGALTANVRRGTHAFWAMHERPAVDDSMHVEAIVLIRARPDSDIVYVVSFLDIESALSFTRFELRRGLHIRNVMIYWAAFTQVREELEGVSIIPAVAPPTVADVAPFSPDTRLEPANEAPPQASVAVAEPEPDTASSVESEARAVVEEALVLQHPPVAEPVAEPKPPAPDPLVLQRQETEWTQKLRWAFRDKRRQRADQPGVVGEELPQIVAEPVASAPGDEEAERDEPIAPSAAVDPAEGLPKAAKFDEFDVALEVEQLLKNRKWETRNGPFSGFKSPPGRF
jgi:hypothetical protein